ENRADDVAAAVKELEETVLADLVTACKTSTDCLFFNVFRSTGFGTSIEQHLQTSQTSTSEDVLGTTGSSTTSAGAAGREGREHKYNKSYSLHQAYKSEAAAKTAEQADAFQKLVKFLTESDFAGLFAVDEEEEQQACNKLQLFGAGQWPRTFKDPRVVSLTQAFAFVS
ncbi:unnamed protein product, partial [Amoebophrya sp. A120]